MYVPTTIRITALKSNPNPEGLIPIVLQFTQNRKSNRIFLRKYVRPEHWISRDGEYVLSRGNDAPENAMNLNMFLNNFLAQAQERLLDYQRNNKVLNFVDFKSQMIDTKRKDFILFCQDELERRRQSGKYSDETLKSNSYKLAKLQRFTSSLSMHEITVSFLEKYEVHMRVDLGNDVNTIFAAMKFIRTMLNVARKQKLTKAYPFEEYKLKEKKNTRDRLSPEELKVLRKLYDDETLPDHLQRVLRYFLFACYTGLSWSDLVSLDYDEISERGDNLYVIAKDRQKTKEPFLVPLMEKAKVLIDMSQEQGKVFPDIVSNQKANLNIKKVIQATKIKKSVSFHVARHTFGTVALNQGIRREAIQRMMGHSKEEMTRLYSKMLDQTVFDEMRKWDNDVVSTNYKDNADADVIKTYQELRTQFIAARMGKGFTQEEMATRIGVKTRDFMDMEMGQLQFGIVHLLQMGKILELDVVGLLERVVRA